MYKVTIIANGDFPRHSIPLLCIQEANHIVCCDGALVKLLNASITIHDGQRIDVVGDGDSLRQAGIDTSNYHFHQITEQDDNDLTKAFNWTLKQHSSPLQITIVGATGLREDHTLANISLLIDYYDTLHQRADGSTISIISDYGCFTPMSGHKKFASFQKQQVSIFSFAPHTPITSQRLRYALNGTILDKLWQGTLNEAVGASFELTGGTMIVYQSHEPKV